MQNYIVMVLFFYEHENYEIVIESKGDYNVEFFS